MRLFLVLFCMISFGLQAQIVEIEPTFPTVNDDITIYYDATKGSGGLIDVDQVYIHTGIITATGGPGNWQNVQGNWGTDDPKVKMINEGDNIHSISFNVKNYYALNASQENDVVELGMVFRNVDGTKEGKTQNFSDIFTPIYSGNEGLLGKFLSPASNSIFSNNEDIEIRLAFNEEANYTLFDNGIEVLTGQGQSVETVLSDLTPGNHEISYSAEFNGEVIEDSITIIVNPSIIPTGDDPDNLPYGATKINETTVRLKLYAPFKEFVYVIGDFNDWKVDGESLMTRSINTSYFWIDIENLNPSGHFSYQYLVNGSLKIADPYSTLVLDDFHDAFIAEDVFPALPDFPEETTGRVSWFQMNPEAFNWTDEDFVRPEQTRLNIYELLVRDFVQDRSFRSVRDSLIYLKEMGINAIELMPVSEFEGNDSWGYNPSFHMALDKYYGTPEDFKLLVNTAHELGIAVILDVVYNHGFSQHPYAQLYWENNRPAANSPFFNQEAKHPFNVGYDFNHEKTATKDYVKRTCQYWIDEFHIDGFRFDLSKGFTQKMSTDDGVFASYDASRIAILKEYADFIWAIDPQFYIILEHFATNSEEEELSDYGMMLWNNANHTFNEATMGYNNSNFGFISYKQKGWTDPHAVGYMESHDEERLQYKNLNFGNSLGDYDTREAETGYDRNELAAVFFYSIPGPKLMWQFGELGYDYSINWCTNGTIDPSCRLTPKPVRWDYAVEQGRADLRLVYKAMMELRESQEVMHTDNFALDLGGSMKRIKLSGEQEALVLGNFGLEEKEMQSGFNKTGWWYEYFSGDSLFVEDTEMTIPMQAGEYRMYWDQKLETPILVGNQPNEELNFEIFPNPGTISTLKWHGADKNVKITLFDSTGRIRGAWETKDKLLLEGMEAGMYYLRINSGDQQLVKKWIVP